MLCLNARAHTHATHTLTMIGRWGQLKSKEAAFWLRMCHGYPVFMGIVTCEPRASRNFFWNTYFDVQEFNQFHGEVFGSVWGAGELSILIKEIMGAASWKEPGERERLPGLQVHGAWRGVLRVRWLLLARCLVRGSSFFPVRCPHALSSATVLLLSVRSLTSLPARPLWPDATLSWGLGPSDILAHRAVRQLQAFVLNSSLFFASRAVTLPAYYVQVHLLFKNFKFHKTVFCVFVCTQGLAHSPCLNPTGHMYLRIQIFLF